MKKFLGAIISGAVGVLSLIFLCLPAFKAKGVLTETSYTGWELLTKKNIVWVDNITALSWYRFFAWVLVVFAIVLILLAVLQLLSSLGIIKMPAILSKVTVYALIGLAIASILALVSNFGICNELVDATKLKDVYSVMSSLWFVAITSVVGAVVGKLFIKD